MKMPIAAILIAFVLQQKPPSELQVSQLEDPRSTTGVVVIVAAQTSAVTPQQLPAIQLEQSPQQIATQRFNVLVRAEGPADLRDILNALAQAHGLNLVMADEISGSVTQDLRNVNLQEALDAILTPRNLQYRIDGNLLRVLPIEMETRTFNFDYITTIRTLSRSVSASSTAGGGGFSGGNIGGAAGGTTLGGIGGGGGGGGSSTSVTGTESTQLLIDLEAAIRSLTSGGGGPAGTSPAAGAAPGGTGSNVVFNRMAGIILVKDFPRNLDTIGLYIETIQNAVNRQVIIEAKVVEVKLNEDSQFGVNWTAVLGNAVRMEQALGSASVFQITGTIGDFNAVVTALKNQGTVNVRSAPTVATLNNQPAVIRVGTQDVFFTTTTQVDPRTGTIVQSAVTPSAINEGIVLDVTPQISDDGIITMNIHPTITERTGQAVSPRGDSVPIVDVRESDTVLRVADGETVVIAGLISERELETVNKVPVLGDIPLLGGLFRRTNKENRKTDLVILLTPRILNIRTAADYARSRIETQERLKPEQKQ